MEETFGSKYLCAAVSASLFSATEDYQLAAVSGAAGSCEIAWRHVVAARCPELLRPLLLAGSLQFQFKPGRASPCTSAAASNRQRQKARGHRRLCALLPWCPLLPW